VAPPEADVVRAAVEVPATDVVDLAIAVVVDAVSRIVRIGPDAGARSSWL
jgi:hypothetical protein